MDRKELLENLPPNLTRPAASEYLKACHGIRRTAKTLAKLACIGGGPRFRKDGRLVVYPVEELDAWAQNQLSAPMSSTAEYEAA